MHLDLMDLESDALATLLRRTIDDDRHPLSARLQISEGGPEQDPPGAGTNAATAAEGVCAVAGWHETAARVRPEHASALLA